MKEIKLWILRIYWVMFLKEPKNLKGPHYCDYCGIRAFVIRSLRDKVLNDWSFLCCIQCFLYRRKDLKKELEHFK